MALFALPKALVELVKAFKAAADGKAPTKNGAGWSFIDPPAPQVNPDWSAVDGPAEIFNKPALFSGMYSDLSGKPTLFSGAYSDLTGKPGLFSGAYADLTGKPSLFSGAYADLTGKPTIPTGLPAGGTTGQVLSKVDDTDFNTQWINPAAGGSGDLLSPLTAAEVSITGATTATISKMHVCSGTSADYTVTLPSPTAGKLIGFRMAPGLTKLVTLDAGVGSLIDGQRYRIMWANEVALLLADGTNWTKVAGKSIPMIAELYAAGSQTIPNAYTKITLNNARGNAAALLCDASNSKIIVKRAGRYTVSALLQEGNNAAGKWLLTVVANGVTNVNIENKDSIPVNAFTSISAVLVQPLSVNDYLELFSLASAGSLVLNTGADTQRMGIYEICEW